ncbi:tripartite motif-containing protein 16-like protein isoform X2, partial [Clarias magur]
VYNSLSDLSLFDDVPHVTVSLPPFKQIQSSVSELGIKVKEFCEAGLHTKPTS